MAKRRSSFIYYVIFDFKIIKIVQKMFSVDCTLFVDSYPGYFFKKNMIVDAVYYAKENQHILEIHRTLNEDHWIFGFCSDEPFSKDQ